MGAIDSSSDDCSDRHATEHVIEGLPQLDREPPLALVKEPIDLVDGGFLVIPPQEKHTLGVHQLESKQQTDGLHGASPSVHVVSQEQVPALGRNSPSLEQREEVSELPVQVSRHQHRRRDLEQHGLLVEGCASSETELGEEFLREGSRSPRPQKSQHLLFRGHLLPLLHKGPVRKPLRHCGSCKEGVVHAQLGVERRRRGGRLVGRP